MKVSNKSGCILDMSQSDYERLISRGMEFTIVEEELNELECSICGKVCKSKLGLASHLRSHYKNSLISVIIPSRVGETIDTLKSLKKQTFKNFEVIIEWDKKKEGAAATRNKGLKKAKGDYIFFCDNDIDLEPDCLESLWLEIQRTKASWVYGKFFIDNSLHNEGKNPEVPSNIYSEKYIKHFYCISTMSLIDAKAKPMFDPEMRRFDDWDLWLTLDKAGHKGTFLDKVLFKTKFNPKGLSNNDAEDIKKWTDKLYKKHKIGHKLADIIIPHHNRHDHLKECLDRLDNSIFNIIIVSGGTFAENCNKGAKIATTSNLIFLNDDTYPDNNILADMAKNGADIVGVAQTQPKYPGLTLYGIGYKRRGDKLVARLSRKPDETHIPSGYCFKVKKSVWEEMGGLDEIYKNGAEDQDFGFRALEAGYTIDYILDTMVHIESQSEGRHAHGQQNQDIFDNKWTDKKKAKMLNI
jgi:GT2 family glycosyltransferase